MNLDLADLIGMNDSDSPSVAPEAAIATLREVAARYADPITFGVGDVVTPRNGYNYRTEGQPHVIVALGDRSFIHDEQGAHHVARRDVAAATLRGANGGPMIYWFDAWALEPYAEPKARS